MIRVGLVDDEDLVRKGIRATFPWAEFGMEVAGEASNGHKALALLESTDIDLLFVDLTMPAMSGFELIQAVRMRFPAVFFVVLTCHEQFQFIQTALRLGAIDYILKTELDQDKIEAILTRVREYYDTRKPLPPRAATMDEEDTGYLFLSRCVDADLRRDVGGLGYGYGELRTVRLGEGGWFVRFARPIPAAGDSLLPLLADKWLIAEVRGVSDLPEELLRVPLGTLADKELFYMETGSAATIAVYDAVALVVNGTVGDTGSYGGGQGEEEFRLWRTFDWVFSERELRLGLDRLRALRLSRSDITDAVRLLIGQWNGRIDPDGGLELPESWAYCRRWEELRARLFELQATLKRRLRRSGYSDDINWSIVRTAHYLHEGNRWSEGIQEAAKHANMSSSYFSKAFKAVTGKTYSDYCKEIKIERTKTWLRESDYPIYLIANRLGFEDEKYFSRWFRDTAGMLPSEYRTATQNARSVSG